jgi:hypothetical protein
MAAPIAATPRPPGLPPEYVWDGVTGMYVDPKTGTKAAWTGAAPTAITGEAYDAATKRMMKEVGGNLALSGGLQVAQSLLDFVPTAQDRRNKQEIAKLEQMEERGTLGLSGQERSQLERDLLNPTRALAHESRQREEELAAASGGRDVGSLVRANREERRRVDAATQQAGSAISRANLEKADAQLRELEQRYAYKSERAGQRLDSAQRGIAEVGKLVGKTAAAQAQEVPLTVADLKTAYPALVDLDDATLALWLKVDARTPGYLNSKVRELSGQTPTDALLTGAVAPS